MKKITNINVKTIIDENGTVKEEIKELNFYTKNEPSFIKTYLDDIIDLLSVNHTTKNILIGLLKFMDYKNRIDMNAYRKKILAEELDTSVRTINNAITNLSKKNIFIRLGTGSYLVNPKYFAKGKWSDISMIRTIIEYTKNGRTLITEFERISNKE